MKKIIIPAFILFAVGLGCKKTDVTTTVPTDDTTATDSTATGDGTMTNNFSRLYAKMYNITSIDTSGSTNIIIKTTDVPDHGSPFFPEGSAKYEAYNGDNPDFSTQINLMGTLSDPDLLTQNVTFTIPRYPVAANTNSATTGGPIGIARNGVVFFNQYNGAGALLDLLEIDNADQYLGHPTPVMGNRGAQYHYHYEPKFLTATYGNSSFMGFLLDGFPVYGPYENGKKITTADLDVHNGHVSSTEDYPNNTLYHYHVISANTSVYADLIQAAPWINGGTYYGTKGTVN